MSLRSAIVDKIVSFFKVIFIGIWLSNLASTDAYISVYVIIAFSAFYSLIRKVDFVLSRKEYLTLQLVSVVFSVLVIMANYPLFTRIRDLAYIQSSTNLMVNVLNSMFSFIGGWVVGYAVLSNLYGTIKYKDTVPQRFPDSKEYIYIVLGSFFLILAIFYIHLFFVEYPGNVTEDPFTQIGEMVNDKYSNFNTYWHTKFFQGVLSIGYWLFGEINAAVAFYCAVQAAFMACVFSFCISTLYLMGVPFFYLIISFLIYSVLPYNIALSITIWKDVLFSGGCLLMVCSIFRIIHNLGKWKTANYVALGVGCIVFSLSRNNGWYVFLLSLIIFVYSLRVHKKMLLVMFALFIACWTMVNPMLLLLNVSGGDYTESLSVPLQQIARVITDDCELTEEESELIGRVLDIEEVPELYTNWLSDPIKIEFRSNDTLFFEENVGTYVKLWFNLGLRYPATYVKAWVDQTKGYWNAGYGYAMYSETVTDNPYGVEKSGGDNLVALLFRLYFGLSRHVIFFEPLHSIGLHVWVTVLCLLFNLMLKRNAWILSVPGLIIVAGLCFGTPVYASFRYAYPVFLCMPIVLGSTLYRARDI